VPILELNSSGTTTAVNTFGVGGLVSRATTSSDVFYQFDAQGTTAERLNASASVLSSQGADAYGHPIVSPTTNDPFDGYGAQLGYYTDHETGLQLLGYRYYDPTNGRFINRDPAGANGGLDAYRYACNSPVSAWDPSGLHPGFGQRDASGLGGWMGLVKYLSPVDMACDFLGKMGTDFGNLAGNATPTAWANCSRDVGEGLLTIDGPEGEVAEGAAAGIKSIEEIDAGLEGLSGIGSPEACGIGAGAAGADPVIPSTLARIIPNGIPATTLGAPSAIDVFVTTPEALEGLDAAGIAQRLTIPESQTGFQVFEFATPDLGLASPVFRTDPGFVQGGYTAGGAPEFVIPNGPIPASATVRTVL
jgi:RHS repeat-associated protein